MSSQDKALPVLLALGNPAEKRSRSELVNRALHTALTLLDADAVAYHMTPSRKQARLLMHAGSSVPSVVPLDPEGSDALRLLAEHGQPIVVPDLSVDARITRDGCPGLESGPVMFTPLRLKNAVCGYIATYRRRGRANYSMGDTRQMVLVSAWLESALENLRLVAGSKGAITDELTEVFNHRFVRTALRREIRRASRFGQELALVVVGMDPTAEEHTAELDRTMLVKELASTLAPLVRAFDIMARYQDDRFMLVLPQTARQGAVEAAERMRAAVEGMAFPGAPVGSITVSVGVASYPQDATDVDDLIPAADRALAEAQQHGGNTVVTLAKREAPPVTRSASEIPRIRPIKRAG